MDLGNLVTFLSILSICVSVLIFIITYMYAIPLKTMIASIKECVQEIKVAIGEMREDAQTMRADVERLKDHEKNIWREINALKDAVRCLEKGDND